jgi:hypothetical protein
MKEIKKMNLNELTPEQLNALNQRMQRESMESNANIDPLVQKTTFGDTLDTDKLAYTDPLIIQHNQAEYGDDVISSGGHNLSLDAKIKQLEKDMGRTLPTMEGKSSSYLDDAGDETFYVKNISEGHVIIGGGEKDTLNIKVPKGDILDLLSHASLEDLKGSREIRVCLSGPKKLLKRLTQSEYFTELQNMADMQKKIEILKRQESIKNTQRMQNVQNNPQMNLPHMRNMNIAEPQNPNVRMGMMETRLEKLRLARDINPENAQHGMSDLEFISWVSKESLSTAECDYLAGDPIMQDKHDIKAALYQKKAAIS